MPPGAGVEVVAGRRRRSFSKADKQRILEAAERCTAPGEVGALLRREGVYSSSLSTWRKQRKAAELAALAPHKRGPKPAPDRDQVLQIAQLTRDNDRLRGRLDKALFIGLPGTGKTHLAVGIGLEVMEHHGAAVLFTTVMRAVRRVKDTWGRDSRESESEAIAALVFPDLLILDEVGVQFGSDTEKLLLFDILNERYERRRPTILMSNLALDDAEEGGRVVPGIKSYLGERVFDRLREDGGQYVVFDWPSHRKGGDHA